MLQNEVEKVRMYCAPERCEEYGLYFGQVGTVIGADHERGLLIVDFGTGLSRVHVNPFHVKLVK